MTTKPMTTKPKTAAPESCQVKSLMETASRLVTAYDNVDQEDGAASGAKDHSLCYFNSLKIDLLDRLDAIATHASILRAQSFEGVLFQIALVNAELEKIDDTDEEEIDKRAIATRAIVRMLYSIGRAVEELTGHADKLGGPIGGERAIEYFMSRRLDPHNQVEGFLIKSEAA